MEVINIGKKQRATRGALGAVVLLLSAYLAFFYIQDITLLWALALFVLIYNGVFLLFEAQTGVCPVNAYREKQSMSGWLSMGKEDLQDRNLSAELKKITRKNSIKTLAITVLVMLVILLA